MMTQGYLVASLVHSSDAHSAFALRLHYTMQGTSRGQGHPVLQVFRVH